MHRLHYSLLLGQPGVWLMGGCAVLGLLTNVIGMATKAARIERGCPEEDADRRAGVRIFDEPPGMNIEGLRMEAVAEAEPPPAGETGAAGGARDALWIGLPVVGLLAVWRWRRRLGADGS